MKIKFLLIIGTLTSCSLLHHQDNFEMERLSEDVLSDKHGQGISIQILPIPASK